MCWPEPRPAVPWDALSGLALEPSDQLFEVLGRESRRAHHGEVGVVRQPGHRHEVVLMSNGRLKVAALTTCEGQLPMLTV